MISAMPKSKRSIPPETMDWLLDPSDPSPRYLALRHLCGLASNDPQLAQARRAAHMQGPIAALLDNMLPDGYWAEAGPGYNPKYRSSVWALITLAQLGASVDEDPRIDPACRYLVEQSMTDIGQFTAGGTPSTTVDCLQGNLCSALVDLGWEDPHLEKAYEWLALSITGEGVAPNTERDAFPRYYAGNCGPAFQCGANNKLACAWGAVKCLLALGKCPPRYQSPMIEQAINVAVDFLLGIDPATAAYPTGYAARPSGNWWKFGFPVFYVTDLLQLVEALTLVGKRDDPRLINSFDLIKGKQDGQGRWPLEYDYRGKMWVEFGEKKQANKWVTIRAYQALGAVSPLP
jgi:hypothetical protein